MGFIWYIIIGIVAGFLAGKIIHYETPFHKFAVIFIVVYQKLCVNKCKINVYFFSLYATSLLIGVPIAENLVSYSVMMLPSLYSEL